VNLRVPGPTPLPPSALQASGRQMINHRGPEFAELISYVTARLQACFATTNDVLTLTGSGTGGLEAAIVNVLSPGDRVLSVSTGVFGDRFAAIARAYGVEVLNLATPWGEAADPARVESALAREKDVKAVILTHNETSTGVTNDLRALAEAARPSGALLLVDAVSSLGALPLPVDEWELDVVVTASQKAWMAPPGLVMLSVSERAWRAHEKAGLPRFYWDFAAARRYLERGQTPWTPAVSVLYSLAEALALMESEGFAPIIARHKRVGERARQHMRNLGLDLFPRDLARASDTVTAVQVPAGVDGGTLLRLLREEHDVVLAGGQGQLAGKIFRIGHMGWVSEEDIDQVATALGQVLPQATKRGTSDGQG
jgi:aspartate aminotransferase-like enzyme